MYQFLSSRNVRNIIKHNIMDDFVLFFNFTVIITVYIIINYNLSKSKGNIDTARFQRLRNEVINF